MPKFRSSTQVLRVRRHQPTRLEGFVDASFAFAVTLLVISIGHTPDSVPEMLLALRGIPAFAACFLLMARMWNSHRNWSRYYGIEDTTAVLLSLLLVFLVLLYVYPLRLLFSLLFAGASGGWLAERSLALNDVSELRAAYIVYGLGFASIGLVFVALHRHALRLGASIGLSAAEVLATRMHRTMWLSNAVIALLSVAFAALLPADGANGALLISLPGYIYLLIFFLLFAIRRWYMHRINGLASDVPA